MRTPVKLASLGHIAEIWRRVAPSSHDWHLSKADHEEAYKQLPLQADHAGLEAVTLRNPEGGL